MKYVIYKLRFTAPVHFGKTALSNSECTLCSDTLFSALCSEAVGGSQDKLDEVVNYVRNGVIKISDALPYFNDEYYLPKPYIFIERLSDGDSVSRKAYKTLKYVPLKDYESYLKGEYDVLSSPSINEIGVSSVKISASIRNDDNETKPYEVGTFTFNVNCGLYIIVGCDNEVCEALMDDLMMLVSCSGLGGKRSSGYGRFTYDKCVADAWLVNRLCDKSDSLMLLNTAFPKETELEEALVGAQYSLIRRGGFVASSNYADSWQRKKDMVMFKSGSVFCRSFFGDVYDVSTNVGKHPVYRYGKPFFMRIDV